MKKILSKLLKENNFVLRLIESLFGRASYMIFTMIFTFVCTRLYGAEAFGSYTFSYTIVILIMIFVKAGQDNGLIYHIPKYGNKQVSLSFVITTIISTIVITISLFVVDDKTTTLMLPLVFLVAFEQLFFGIYRATNRIKGYYLINGFFSLLLRISLTIIFFFAFGSNVLGIVLSVYISFLFANFIYFIQNRKRFKKVEFDKSFVRFSTPLILATFMGMVIDKVDILMLGVMTSKTDVGIYQVSVQVVNVLITILFIFNTVFAPRISQLYHSGKIDELKRLYINSTRILALIAMVSTLLIAIFSGFILQIFGSEFTEGQHALIFRAIGQFFNVAVGSVWLMLTMTGKPRLQMYTNIMACILNVVLNFILIPHYGIKGAAVASFITVSLTNIIGYVLVKREFRLKVFKLF